MPLKFHPQFSYYTHGSFKKPKEIQLYGGEKKQDMAFIVPKALILLKDSMDSKISSGQR